MSSSPLLLSVRLENRIEAVHIAVGRTGAAHTAGHIAVAHIVAGRTGAAHTAVVHTAGHTVAVGRIGAAHTAVLVVHIQIDALHNSPALDLDSAHRIVVADWDHSS